MIDFLLGVPGKLATIIGWFTNYWTAARAAKIDYLDATISSRAPASTAVSNANYTAGRAALLDGIIQNSVINSIQTGTTIVKTAAGIGYTVDLTISAVNVSKCFVFVQGQSSQAWGYMSSTTNLHIESITAVNTTGGLRWWVVEFK
jgi:hypothetical protein